jgi:long-chain acyl-CoA synthetase
MPMFHPGKALEIIERERVSILLGPPTIFHDLINHPDRSGHDLSSLRVSMTGGTTIPESLIHAMKSELSFDIVMSAYGLTESCATTIFNRPDAPEYGTVGRPLPGTAVRIAPDGEVLLRGPGVMSGYHGLSSDEVLVDGWLHTGDIGEITERGSLRITDRKKDLIKTSNGKYVAPQAVEARFKALCPLAGQILVHGENRKYVTALIDLDPDAVAQLGLPGSYAEITRSPEVTAEIARGVEKLNAGLNPWETVKKFLILDHHLDIESGILTPSLKLRRRVAEDRYRPQLDSLYT